MRNSFKYALSSGKRSMHTFAWGRPLPCVLGSHQHLNDWTSYIDDGGKCFDILPDNLYAQIRRLRNRTDNVDTHTKACTVPSGGSILDRFEDNFADTEGFANTNVDIDILFITVENGNVNEIIQQLGQDIETISNSVHGKRIKSLGVSLPSSLSISSIIPKLPSELRHIRISANLFSNTQLTECPELLYPFTVWTDSPLEWRTEQKRGPLPKGAHSFRTIERDESDRDQEQEIVKKFDHHLQRLIHLEKTYEDRYKEEIESGELPRPDDLFWGHQLTRDIEFLHNHTRWHHWVSSCVQPSIEEAQRLMLRSPNFKQNGVGMWQRNHSLELNSTVATFTRHVDNRLEFINSILLKDLDREYPVLSKLGRLEDKCAAVLFAAGTNVLVSDSCFSQDDRESILEVQSHFSKSNALELLQKFASKPYPWKYTIEIQ